MARTWTFENDKEVDSSLTAFVYGLVCSAGLIKPLLQAVVCWSVFLLAYRTDRGQFFPTLCSATSRGSLKLTTVGIFIPQKLANATNQSSLFPPDCRLVNVCQHITAYRVMVRLMGVEHLAHGTHICTHAWHTGGTS